MMPEIVDEEGVTEVPHFKVIYNDQTHYDGNGSDWATLKDALGEQLAAVVDAGATHSTSHALDVFDHADEDDANFVEAIQAAGELGEVTDLTEIDYVLPDQATSAE